MQPVLVTDFQCIAHLFKLVCFGRCMTRGVCVCVCDQTVLCLCVGLVLALS